MLNNVDVRCNRGCIDNCKYWILILDKKVFNVDLTLLYKKLILWAKNLLLVMFIDFEWLILGLLKV